MFTICCMHGGTIIAIGRVMRPSTCPFTKKCPVILEEGETEKNCPDILEEGETKCMCVDNAE